MMKLSYVGRAFVKKMYSLFLFYFIYILGVFRKTDYSEDSFEVVVIPLYKTMGIGDSIMLSPIIYEIARRHTDKSIIVHTHLPLIQEYPPNVKILRKEDTSFKKKPYLLVSITLNLRHFLLIRKSKLWVGYFARQKIQSNIRGIKKYGYCGQTEHFIQRGIRVLDALYPNTSFSCYYPHILTEKYPMVDEKLDGITLSLGLFSQFDHSMWSLDKAAKVINYLYEKQQINTILLLGDQSSRNRQYADELLKKLLLPKKNIIDVVGKTSLKEAAYCINKSNYFLGLDSGLAHLAYTLDIPSVAIFVIVKPSNILPVDGVLLKKIYSLSAYEEADKQLFTGRNVVDINDAQKRSNQITTVQVKEKFLNMINVCSDENNPLPPKAS